MSNCLDNWIGIYGCDAPSNVSGVYINSLPGISMKSLEELANEEQVTYLGVWLDVQTRGIRKFYNRLQSELSKKYRLKTLRATVDLGNILNKDISTTGTGQYRGFSYELKLQNQYRRSDFQALNVQKLKLYLQADGTIPVKIVDMDTAEVLWSTSLTGVAGWNTIQVNESFSAQRLFFGYDDTGLTAYSLPINDSNADWLNTSLYSIYGYDCCNAVLRGAVTTDATVFDTEVPLEVSTSNDTYGLSAVFSLVCKYDFLICNNKELFTTALWYLLGAEVMIERQASDRLNKYTTIDRAKAEKLQEAFTTEYESELQLALDGVILSTEDACIDCNTQIEVMTALL